MLVTLSMSALEYRGWIGVDHRRVPANWAVDHVVIPLAMNCAYNMGSIWLSIPVCPTTSGWVGAGGTDTPDSRSESTPAESLTVGCALFPGTAGADIITNVQMDNAKILYNKYRATVRVYLNNNQNTNRPFPLKAKITLTVKV